VFRQFNPKHIQIFEKGEFMTRIFAWALALTMLTGTLAMAAIDCCADPACCASGCCHRSAHVKK
jgi:hypothetical protein